MTEEGKIRSVKDLEAHSINLKLDLVENARQAARTLKLNLEHEDAHVQNEAARILLEAEHRERHSAEVK